jgi:MFS transporter, VNT family, synaptic vesicle glycoprotein 2
LISPVSNVRDDNYNSSEVGSNVHDHNNRIPALNLNNTGSPNALKKALVAQNSHNPASDPEQGYGYRADFETAIELTGYGKFHYILLGICGLVSTSEEMDVISM